MGCSGQGQVRGDAADVHAGSRERYNRAAVRGKRSGHLGAQGVKRQSFWGATRVKAGPLAVGCRWESFQGRPVRGVGMSQWGLPRNRGGLSSHSHSTVPPEGRRPVPPSANVLRGAVSNNPPQGSHIRPRPAARGVSRCTAHPRPPSAASTRRT